MFSRRPGARFNRGRVGASVSPAGTTVAFSLANPFVDDAILQRDQAIPIWGRATTGKKVSVSIDGVTAPDATADSSGIWIATVPSHIAGGPYSLTATCEGTTITRTGVKYGDVYLFQGQSNQLSRIDQLAGADYSAAIADSTYPDLRFYIFNSVPSARIYAATPQLAAPSPPSAWTKSSSTSIDAINAIGWLACREVHKAKSVPVGIVLCAEGGTSIQHWMPAASMSQFVDFSDTLAATLADNPANWDASTQVVAYNGMLRTLMPMGLKGICWYQGESAASNLPQRAIYTRALTSKIATDRADFGGSPRYFVISLPNAGVTVQSNPIESSDLWPLVREAQELCGTSTVHVLATCNDTADNDLHPLNKPKVANWLKLSMLQNVYGDAVVGTPLKVSSWAVVGSTIELTMNTSLFGPASAAGFAITADRSTWFSATATKSGSKYILSSASVGTPVAWRYSWANNPIGDAAESTNNMPLNSCRSDVDYELQVTGGTGDGRYLPGTVVAISATLSGGQGIAQWDGDYSAVANRYSATTTVTMPSSDVSIVARVGLEPSVAITSPTAGASVPLGSPITITGTVSVAEGSLTSVSVYQDSTLLGTATVAGGSWSYAYTPSTGGTGYTATALCSNGVRKSATVAVSIGSALQDAINAILALSPTVFRIFKNSAAYIHEDATNPGKSDQVIDLVSSPANDLTNATDATQPYISTVGSDGAIKTVRGEGRFMTEPSWGSSATKLTEVLGVRFNQNGITQYVISRDAGERSWIHDSTNIVKFTCGAVANSVTTSGAVADGLSHLFAAVYDGTQAVATDRAKMYMDGADVTAITGTIPASLTAIAAARYGMSSAGGTEGSHEFLVHIGWSGTALTSGQLATVRTNCKVICSSLP